MFDFDRVIERRGTHASKWDNMAGCRASPRRTPFPCGWRTWISPPRPASPRRWRRMTRRAVYGYYADTGSWAARARRLDGAPARPARSTRPG